MVYTGIALITFTKIISDVAQTRVSFVQLSDSEIAEYTRSGEPRDKAGGYAIQGCGAALVAAIEGDYFNVVGLPVPTLLEMTPGLLPA